MLTQEQIKCIIEILVSKSDPVRIIELTPYNWIKEFGDDGFITTPIGIVKMGDNQYLKLLTRGGRDSKLGLIKPTLQCPLIIIEDSGTAKSREQSERETSFVFVKTFHKNEERIYFFTTVTVKKDGREVVISCQEKKPKRISALLKEGKLTYVNFAATPSFAVSKERGDQFVIPNGANSSIDKII